MAERHFTIHTQVLNIQLPFKLYTFLYITKNLILHSFILTFTTTIPVTPTKTENYLPSDDPSITNKSLWL